MIKRSRQYKILPNLKEVLRKYDYEEISLEDYLVGCTLVEDLVPFDMELHGKNYDNDKIKNTTIIKGKVLQTDHPMPYCNVHVWLPVEALEEIL